MVCYFSNILIYFIFCSLNFIGTFYISYKILTKYVHYYCILIRIV